MSAHAYWRIKILTYGGGSGGSGFSNVMEINFTDSSGAAFSRSGATAFDSAHFSGSTFDAAKAIDANTGTTWSGDPSVGWPAFYLGIQYTSAVDVYGVQLASWDTSAPITFDVEYSDDGTNWFTRASGVDASTWAGSTFFGQDATLILFDTPSGAGAHAYWRCLVSYKRRAFGGGNFFGNTAGIGFYDSGNTLLSTGGTALDSGNFGTAPSGVFANPTGGSLWSGDFNALVEGIGPAYLGYQHTGNVTVDHVTIYPYDNSQFLGFYLQYSDNGTTWVTQQYFQDFVDYSGSPRTYTVTASPPNGTGDLEFGVVSIAGTGTGSGAPSAAGDLEFGAPSIAGQAGLVETGTADLEFAVVTFEASVSVIHVKGTADLEFGNMTLEAVGTIPGAAGTGLRQFWTF